MSLLPGSPEWLDTYRLVIFAIGFVCLAWILFHFYKENR